MQQRRSKPCLRCPVCAPACCSAPLGSVRAARATEASAAELLHAVCGGFRSDSDTYCRSSHTRPGLLWRWETVGGGDREAENEAGESQRGYSGLCTSVALAGFSCRPLTSSPVRRRAVRLAPSPSSSVLPEARTRKPAVSFLLSLCPGVVWMGCNNREGERSEKKSSAVAPPSAAVLYCTRSSAVRDSLRPSTALYRATTVKHAAPRGTSWCGGVSAVLIYHSLLPLPPLSRWD